MKRFDCQDILPGCPFRCEGSQDEILASVRNHIAQAHGLDAVPWELLLDVQDAMVPVS